MKRKSFNPHIIIVFADKKVVSDAEFMSKCWDIPYENNKHIIDSYAYSADPKYHDTSLYIKRFELKKERLAMLEAERKSLLKEMKDK